MSADCSVSSPRGDKGDNGGFTGTYQTIIANTATLALGPTDTGAQVILDKASGTAITLPSAPTVGTFYDFTVRTSITSNTTTITASGSDTYEGFVFGMKSATAPAIFSASAAFTDHIFTMNGSTQGGLIGTEFRALYIASGRWLFSGQTYGSGALATNFT